MRMKYLDEVWFYEQLHSYVADFITTVKIKIMNVKMIPKLKIRHIPKLFVYVLTQLVWSQLHNLVSYTSNLFYWLINNI